MEYKAPDNIYWLFSSSAQAIAAFIGFLATGFFFVYDRIDRQVDKDETLEEIYIEIRKQYYSRLKTLFVLTGLSIILSLLVVYINGYDLGCLGLGIKVGVALLNIVTIVWAISFVILIIDPNKVIKATQKLIKENSEAFGALGNPTLSRGQFLDKFIELERILRDIASRHDIVTNSQGRFVPFLPLGDIIKGLYQREIINLIQLENLTAINKIRNLVAHGQITQVDDKQGKIVDDLIEQLQEFTNK